MTLWIGALLYIRRNTNSDPEYKIMSCAAACPTKEEAIHAALASIRHRAILEEGYQEVETMRKMDIVDQDTARSIATSILKEW